MAALVHLLEDKAHGLRECLGALQLARSPEAERATVNRAIGLLERIRMHLRSGRTVVNLSEELATTGCLSADAEARLKHAALALLEAEIRVLDAAGVEIVHEFSQRHAL